MQKIAVFTIASLNYLAFARTLLSSVEDQHPEYARYLVLVDEPESNMDLSLENFSVVLANDIGINNFYDMAFRYSIMELNTAVKPFFISRLFEMGFEKVIYFDPDIYVYNKLDVVTDELSQHSIVLTPHISTPFSIDDVATPGEQDFLRSGTYNLGFIAIANTDIGRSFSKWWSEKCYKFCLDEVETGLFVDQKWVNLAPALFDSVKVLKHPGCNVSYWNLHERLICDKTVNGVELVFYHFSGIQFDGLDRISKYQNRYSLTVRPEIRSLFEEYKRKVIAKGYYETKSQRYNYSFYSDGKPIPSFARILYNLTDQKEKMPFDASCGFAKKMKSLGITDTSTEQNIVNESYKQRKIALFDGFMFLIFRVLGWRRYMLLLRYFRRIAAPTRQGFILERLSEGSIFSSKKADIL